MEGIAATTDTITSSRSTSHRVREFDPNAFDWEEWEILFDICWGISFCGKMDSLKEKQFATKCKLNLQSFTGIAVLAV
jgi:hypothetical protein